MHIDKFADWMLWYWKRIPWRASSNCNNENKYLFQWFHPPVHAGNLRDLHLTVNTRAYKADDILTPSDSQLLHNKAHYLKAFLIWLEAVFFMLMVRRLYLFQFPSRHNWRAEIQLFSFFFASSLSCVQLGLLGSWVYIVLRLQIFFLNSKFWLHWKTLV